MCRTTLSVEWQSQLDDADFNRMLGLRRGSGLPRNIRDVDPGALANRLMVSGQHSYGCTAGAGSSCRGATVGAGCCSAPAGIGTSSAASPAPAADPG